MTLDDAIPVNPTDPADDRLWCPDCEGDGDLYAGALGDCTVCRGRGWLHEDEFAEFLAEDEDDEDEVEL